MPVSAELMASVEAGFHLIAQQGARAGQAVSELLANGFAYDGRVLNAATAAAILLSDDPEKAMMAKLGYDTPRASEPPAK